MKYTINQLTGKALENAIDNIINTVARCGWGWDLDSNRADAVEVATTLNLKFDENGNSNP